MVVSKTAKAGALSFDQSPSFLVVKGIALLLRVLSSKSILINPIFLND